MRAQAQRGTIWLWEAGQLSSGTAGSPDAAKANAAAHLAPGTEGLVEEARVVMKAANGGLVPGYERSGQAWRGRLEDGVPSWERVAPGEAAVGPGPVSPLAGAGP